MVVSGENTQCQIMLDGEQFEQISEFKYLGNMQSVVGSVKC